MGDAAKQYDGVHLPDHYTWKGTECKDIITAMDAGLGGIEAYYVGCIIKYLYRYPAKGAPVKDLEKAEEYIRMLKDYVQVRASGGVVPAGPIPGDLKKLECLIKKVYGFNNNDDLQSKDLRETSAVDVADEIVKRTPGLLPGDIRLTNAGRVLALMELKYPGMKPPKRSYTPRKYLLPILAPLPE